MFGLNELHFSETLWNENTNVTVFSMWRFKSVDGKSSDAEALFCGELLKATIKSESIHRVLLHMNFVSCVVRGMHQWLSN